MSAVPSVLAISLQSVRELSIECWRLQRMAASEANADGSPALKRVVRNLSEILAQLGVEILDFSGDVYNSGFVAEVIAVQEDATFAQDRAVIDETVLPTLRLRGQIICPGQVVVRQAPRAKVEAEP